MRVFSANCTAGIVTIGGKPVLNCPILGQGGNSEGVVVISETELAYIPNTTPDLSDNIDAIVEALNAIVQTFTDISSGVLPSNEGGAITTGGFASGISAGNQSLQGVITKLNELKARLK